MYTVIAQREIPAPLNTVWAHLTEPALLAKWFGDISHFAPGQPFRMDFGDGDYHTGRVTEWDPEIVLGFVWSFVGLGNESEVRFTMLRRKNGTELSIQDRGALTVKEAECLRVGWSEFLMRLEKTIVQGLNTRFSWRKMITFTGFVNGQKPSLVAALSNAAWYGETFSGMRAEIREAKPDWIVASLGNEKWGEASTELSLDFQHIRGQDYLFVIHQGWGALPDDMAAEERHRFVEQWRSALAPFSVT